MNKLNHYRAVVTFSCCLSFSSSRSLSLPSRLRFCLCSSSTLRKDSWGGLLTSEELEILAELPSPLVTWLPLASSSSSRRAHNYRKNSISTSHQGFILRFDRCLCGECLSLSCWWVCKYLNCSTKYLKISKIVVFLKKTTCGVGCQLIFLISRQLHMLYNHSDRIKTPEQSRLPYTKIWGFFYVHLCGCVLQLSLRPHFIFLHTLTVLLGFVFLFLQTVDLLMTIKMHVKLNGVLAFGLKRQKCNGGYSTPCGPVPTCCTGRPLISAYSRTPLSDVWEPEPWTRPPGRSHPAPCSPS